MLIIWVKTIRPQPPYLPCNEVRSEKAKAKEKKKNRKKVVKENIGPSEQIFPPAFSMAGQSAVS